MKLKNKVLLIVFVIGLIVNCVFWFTATADLLLVLHFSITILLSGLIGWTFIKDEVKNFVN